MINEMIDIKQWNAVGDGITDDTVAVQTAIDICAEERKILYISNGTYKIGTVELRDNSHLFFEEGAVFSGIESVSAYSANTACFVDAVNIMRGRTLVLIYKAKHIVIEGKGMITGNGPNVQTENDRPFLIRVAESEDVIIRDVKLTQSISWCLHIFKSRDVCIEHIILYNRGCPNNDGIDVDSSQNVRIIGCDISSDDDAVCIKTTSRVATKDVYVKDCKISTGWGAFKIGTESVGDISNITLEDCEFYDVVGGGIKIVPTDGAIVDGVKIKNVKMRNCTGPIFIANGERNRAYAGEHSDQLSKVRNVEIDGVEADVVAAPTRGYYDGEVWGNAIGGVILSGTAKSKLENIRLTNMKLSLPGGYTGTIRTDIREMGTMYPEFQRFDPVPAKGIYVRHGYNVSWENIDISYKAEDVRREIYTEDTYKENK